VLCFFSPPDARQLTREIGSVSVNPRGRDCHSLARASQKNLPLPRPIRKAIRDSLHGLGPPHRGRFHYSSPFFFSSPPSLFVVFDAVRSSWLQVFVPPVGSRGRCVFFKFSFPCKSLRDPVSRLRPVWVLLVRLVRFVSPPFFVKLPLREHFPRWPILPTCRFSCFLPVP